MTEIKLTDQQALNALAKKTSYKDAPRAARKSVKPDSKAIKTDNCFQLRGSMLMLTILELYHYSHTPFTQQMSRLIKQAPNFFKQTPIVICLEKIDPSVELDFIELTQVCQDYGLFPIAIRGGSNEQQLNALVAGLPKLPKHKPKVRNTAQEQELSSEGANSKDASSKDQNKSETESKTDNAKKAGSDPVCAVNPCKIVKRPVRSGQQIYASGGDLVIMGAVSQGAEVIADGHIHVYAPLRGRAMAGAKGNKQAQVFCQSLEPELLSIAGHYKISEDIQSQYWGKPTQARLEDGQLKLDSL